MDRAQTTDPRLFRHLLPDQADGLACVVCRASFLVNPPRAWVPVGRSLRDSQVFACAEPKPCAGQLGHQPAEVAR